MEEPISHWPTNGWTEVWEMRMEQMSKDASSKDRPGKTVKGTDAGGEDPDLTFLEGQARKIVEENVKIYNMGCVMSIIWATILSIVLLIEYSGWFDLVVCGILMGAIIIIAHPKIKLLKNKNIQNIFEWNEHFKGRDTGTVKETANGRLENVMRILRSIEPWLRTLYTNELSILILLVMAYWFILGRIPIHFASFGPWWLGLVMGLLLGLVPLILLWSVAWYYHRRRLDFWRPRLETFGKRLDGYWERL